jgi:hypothetical protein
MAPWIFLQRKTERHWPAETTRPKDHKILQGSAQDLLSRGFCSITTLHYAKRACVTVNDNPLGNPSFLTSHPVVFKTIAPII